MRSCRSSVEISAIRLRSDIGAGAGAELELEFPVSMASVGSDAALFLEGAVISILLPPGLLVSSFPPLVPGAVISILLPPEASVPDTPGILLPPEAPVPGTPGVAGGEVGDIGVAGREVGDIGAASLPPPLSFFSPCSMPGLNTHYFFRGLFQRVFVLNRNVAARVPSVACKLRYVAPPLDAHCE